MDWITCPACGLKHSRRADGLCPRCRTGVFAGAPPPPHAPDRWVPPAPAAMPVDGGAAVAVPPPAPAGWEQPLPTRMIAPPRVAPGELQVGALVSRAFSIWWQDVWRYTAAILLAYLPLLVTAGLGGAAAVFAGGTATPSPNLLRALVPWLVLGGIGTFVMFAVQMGGATWAALQRLGGRPVTVGGMLGVGFKRAWPLFAANLLAGLLFFVASLALIVPGLMVAVAMIAVDGIVVAEGVGPGRAIGRSFELTSGSRWTIFGAVVVMALAMWGIDLGASVLNAVLGLAGTGLAVMGTILAVVVQVAVSSLLTVLCAVTYHDLRLAKEGVDTSALERVFE
jgi:hypothetical protein